MNPVSSPCEVAILAGGMGTRLRARTGNLPKPMAPVLGKPVLEHLIELCRSHGFTRIALLVHYEHEAIHSHFGDGSAYGVELRYCIEQDARGTAGALRDALPVLADRFLVLYGDTYADVDLRAIWNSHERQHARQRASGTLLLHPNDHPHDSDLVEVDDEGAIVALRPYPHPEGSRYRNLVNAALYVLEAAPLPAVLPETGKADLAKHTFPAMLSAGLMLSAYVTPEYIKDMGTPERLDKVERDLRTGLPDRLSARALRPAVFLDRDGTLNEEVNHLSRPEDLRLLPGAGEAVRALNRAGMLAVGVTNQPVVARGDVTLQGLARIHAELDHQLGQHGAYLDRLYFCPHHPDRGFPGEVEALKIDCDCRKPKAGLFDRACRELDIDRKASWMVGDSSADILAGTRAGARTILVRSGHAGADRKHAIEPDYATHDLAAAVRWILNGHAAMARRLLPVAAASAATRLVLVGGPARSGKSFAARVLAELAAAAGRKAHVLSLDGWLRPAAARTEGSGVLNRYDLDAALATITPLLRAEGRQWIRVPVYDRHDRQARATTTTSIGPDDLLIVEGVPALMCSPLVASADVRLFIDISDDERHARLIADSRWRYGEPARFEPLIAAREVDEVPAAKASRDAATHVISAGDSE
ncbi:MAG: HAD-IIIA family hydrolase [Mitsuaria chitosanitabida]|uniref:HAD-IIIA family hydrolase n=1 Tax=Roseateles chitosanitabidus TaxID=65048 RepID=UPI001B2ED146|nr:HAD-IIIA family hydrolase [Roseateles chitosanitabidus]MBO9688670.1 HAD-IIIA family hydrolase [Roseateles chitosanitabidus]